MKNEVSLHDKREKECYTKKRRRSIRPMPITHKHKTEVTKSASNTAPPALKSLEPKLTTSSGCILSESKLKLYECEHKPLPKKLIRELHELNHLTDITQPEKKESVSDSIISDINKTRIYRIKANISEELKEIHERINKILNVGGFDEEGEAADAREEESDILLKQKDSIEIPDVHDRELALSDLYDWILCEQRELELFTTEEESKQKEAEEVKKADKIIADSFEHFQKRAEHLASIGQEVLSKIKFLRTFSEENIPRIIVIGEPSLMNCKELWDTAASRVHLVLQEASTWVKAVAMKSALQNGRKQFEIMMAVASNRFTTLTETHQKMESYEAQNIAIKKMLSKTNSDIEYMRERKDMDMVQIKNLRMRLAQSIEMNQKLMSQMIKLRAEVTAQHDHESDHEKKFQTIAENLTELEKLKDLMLPRQQQQLKHLWTSADQFYHKQKDVTHTRFTSATKFSFSEESRSYIRQQQQHPHHHTYHHHLLSEKQHSGRFSPVEVSSDTASGFLSEDQHEINMRFKRETPRVQSPRVGKLGPHTKPVYSSKEKSSLSRPSTDFTVLDSFERIPPAIHTEIGNEEKQKLYYTSDDPPSETNLFKQYGTNMSLQQLKHKSPQSSNETVDSLPTRRKSVTFELSDVLSSDSDPPKKLDELSPSSPSPSYLISEKVRKISIEAKELLKPQQSGFYSEAESSASVRGPEESDEQNRRQGFSASTVSSQNEKGTRSTLPQL